MKAAILTSWVGTGKSVGDSFRPALADLRIGMQDIIHIDAKDIRTGGTLMVQCELSEADAAKLAADPGHGPDVIFELGSSKPEAAKQAKFIEAMRKRGLDISPKKDATSEEIISAAIAEIRKPEARGK